ncbi:hypothetical protein QFZ55_000261 [Streptomyces luteogriseus]|uniref:hypothetical protein n=1 Tax=Streptomyces luteogriseus TaxID=68233 RepID=UPI00278723B3|nr:hypothetical protein [Streptomyces luteogriseus]MDQ0710809.1 hypothetical protein [Streptomyces luteogriseus]
MTFLDDAPDGKPGVTVRCRDNAAVGVTFRGRFSFDADAVHHVGGELCQKRGETGVPHPGDDPNSKLSDACGALTNSAEDSQSGRDGDDLGSRFGQLSDDNPTVHCRCRCRSASDHLVQLGLHL